MQVSTIIPTYNRADETIAAIKSVLSQTAANRIAEVIIVDDGSTDNTYQTIKDFIESIGDDVNPRFVLIQQRNKGAAAARNAGMSAANEDLVAFLDSDDEWLPNKMQEQLDVFDSNPDVDFLGCNSIGAVLRIPFVKVSNLHKAKFSHMMIKSFPITPAVVMKRRIFIDMGGFDTSLKTHEDCNYWQRITLEGFGVYHLQKELVKLSQTNPYGEEGLTADLNQIIKDVTLSLKKHYQRGKINYFLYLLLLSYSYAKHFRRVLKVQKLRK